MKIKRKLLREIAVLSLVLISGANAFAIAIGDYGVGVNSIGSYQSGVGGEFYFRPTSGSVNNSSYADTTKNLGSGGMGSFQTFCLEYNEWLAQGSVNYVVNNQAIGGGNNSGTAGSMGGDVLSKGTAYLYSQFAQGKLDGYAFGGTDVERKLSAGLLQNAIWALEDEITTSQASNPFYNLALANGGKDNYTSGELGVYVLNNTVGTNPGIKKQDMLFYATGASLSVPDGGSTLMLLGLALASISLLARYKKLSPAV